MRTVGVDLSAEFKDTWMATIDWSDKRARLVDLDKAVSDKTIVKAAQRADKIGIDCPFGWPELFFEFIEQHRTGSVPPQLGLGKEWREQLAFRTTDLEIKKRWSGSSILSVSTDKLGRVAFRCAALLAQMAESGIEVDRSGMTGSVVEVYPAGSLRSWSHTYSGYKSNRDVLSEMVETLLWAAPWLELDDEQREQCEEVHDAFDAVIASLTAIAAALNRATGPKQGQISTARIEGWIRLPHEDSLEGLASRELVKDA